MLSLQHSSKRQPVLPSDLTQLQALHLSYTQVSGSLSLLQTLTQLRDLHLSHTQLSGSLYSLQSLTQLQDLHLYCTQVSSNTMALPQSPAYINLMFLDIKCPD